jgi:phosphate transport system protein
LLNRGRNFGDVLAKVPPTVLAHGKVIKQLEYPRATAFRFLVRHPEDPDKELMPPRSAVEYRCGHRPWVNDSHGRPGRAEEGNVRTRYQADLAQVTEILVEMADGARTAMRRASTALLAADGDLAQRVVADDAEIDALYRQVENQVYRLLAQQAPVAGDLRLVITALHAAGDLERMGDLAVHVAKTALRRVPAPAVVPELHAMITGMAGHADQIAAKVSATLRTADIHTAAQLDGDDDAIDELEEQLFAVLLGSGWTHGVSPAIDAAQLGRWYERYADHAVKAGRQVLYLVTGEAPPASRPEHHHHAVRG